MIKRIVLPGSVGDEAAGERAGGGGRFTEDDLGALGEVAAWWRHRTAVGDSAAPLETHFGGVDLRGTARTVGLTPATVEFGRPLGGGALLLLALGVPDPPVVGEVYSLVALAHAYDAPGAGWLSGHTTLGRAPQATTSTEARVVIDGGTGQPVVKIVGVSGLAIDWRVEADRLESGL